MTLDHAVRAGSLEDLQREGRLLTKVGSLPVLVVWNEGRAFAIEDRCPHLGFPLHQGTVEAGLVTCHWHHARFDLASGCTLDPWADDATGFDVALDDGEVLVAARPERDPIGRLQRRLRDGLEQGITLVTAKATLGLLEVGGPEPVLAEALDYGTTYRDGGWGSGLTVLVAMANLLPALDPADRPLEQVGGWYRRFVETRSSDAAERSLATIVQAGDLAAAERVMFAAVTDHVFVDEGHTLDFTNKAFEGVALVGPEHAHVLTSMVRQTCAADRSEEGGEWNHPYDLAGLVARAEEELPSALAAGAGGDGTAVDTGKLAWTLLDDDPELVVGSLLDAVRAGATPEQLGRALAYAAALRITRFHLNNDPGDWNSVHHAFTTANALHQALVRQPTPELHRGLVHGALRVYLDRFLNVPAARLPHATAATLDDLARCWEVQGAVDEAGQAAYGFLRAGGRREDLIAALGHALVQEDAGFHWFQVVEAGARQAMAWPEGSDESALILSGVARFLAAHTPTRRELATVVRTAARLRRGEALYADS
jgi:nitrite reductase/ring-hydroxylating ferredoxin subunit